MEHARGNRRNNNNSSWYMKKFRTGLFLLLGFVTWLVLQWRLIQYTNTTTTTSRIVAPPEQHLGSRSNTSNKDDVNNIHEAAAAASSILLSTTNNNETKTPSKPKILWTQQDYVCHGCRERWVVKRKHCGHLLEQKLKDRNIQIFPINVTFQVLSKVLNELRKECNRCYPQACDEKDKIMKKFDEAGPPILSAKSFFLSSLPSEHRLPIVDNADNTNMTHFWNDYFSNPNHTWPTKQYLSEFNPSIVRIPPDQIPLAYQDSNVVYLASFRISNLQTCVTGKNTLWKMMGYKSPQEYKGWRTPIRSYMGLALLSADLSVVANIMVKPSYRRVTMEDFRLFVSPSQQLYLSSFQFIIPIWLVPPSPTTTHNDNNDNNNSSNIVKLEWEVEREQEMFLKTYDFHQQVDFELYMRNYPSCLNLTEAKNLNYFWNDKNQSIVEVFPMDIKVQIDLEARCNILAPKQGKQEDLPNLAAPPPFSMSLMLEQYKGGDEQPLYASFGTWDEIYYAQRGIYRDRPITTERGGACCLSLTYKGKVYFLGISHSKTRAFHKFQPNHFFSRFYIFQPVEPYKIVAWTGKFCLGFPTLQETKDNPYARYNQRPLEFGSLRDDDHVTTFDCPKIHFVSGMVHDATNSSQIIIMYGVNDCASRAVTVAKADILRMLFPR